jgi:hypothetical protein
VNDCPFVSSEVCLDQVDEVPIHRMQQFHCFEPVHPISAEYYEDLDLWTSNCRTNVRVQLFRVRKDNADWICQIGTNFGRILLIQSPDQVHHEKQQHSSQDWKINCEYDDFYIT